MTRHALLAVVTGGVALSRFATGIAAGSEASQIAVLDARVASLSVQESRLEDANQVRKLQRAYGYYIDKGYWSEAADLFADDATMEVGVDGVYRGKTRIHQLLVREGGGNPGPGLPYGQLNHHMQLQPVVHVSADGTSARGRWRELALLGQYKKYAAWGDGIYENQYVKLDGVWRIRALHYYPNFVAPYKGGWASLPPVIGDWISDVAKSFPADEPPTVDYKPFPNVFTPPFHYDQPISPSGPAGRIAVTRRGATPHTPSSPDVAQLEAAVTRYQNELAALASRDDIQNLQAGYGYYVDKGLWKQAANLFSAHATYEFGQHGIYLGRARILKALATQGPAGLRPGQLNNYMMLQPIIDVASDNQTAQARWRSDIELADAGTGFWSEGEYENEYVNEHGVWKISKLHFYITVLASYEGGWATSALPLDGPSHTLPPDRPPSEVYQSLPEVYLPPYHYRNPVSEGIAVPPPPAFTLTPGASAAVARIERSATQLGTAIERLQDQAAIEKVQRAYGYYVDKAMWPDVSNLFADDGTLEIGGRGVFVGKQRALEYLVTGLGPVGPQHGQIINHQQFQGIVDVAPDGRSAAGRWTAFVMGGAV